MNATVRRTRGAAARVSAPAAAPAARPGRHGHRLGATAAWASGFGGRLSSTGSGSAAFFCAVRPCFRISRLAAVRISLASAFVGVDGEDAVRLDDRRASSPLARGPARASARRAPASAARRSCVLLLREELPRLLQAPREPPRTRARAARDRGTSARASAGRPSAEGAGPVFEELLLRASVSRSRGFVRQPCPRSHNCAGARRPDDRGGDENGGAHDHDDDSGG